MRKSITLKSIKKVNGIINLPGSKSISNRALLLAAQSVGTTYLSNLLDSEDVRYMLLSLKELGINYTLSEDKKNCTIQGIGGPFQCNKKKTLFIGNSGTTIRSLCASLSLHSNDITITGDDRMQERPIGHLVDSLRQGGASIYYLKKDNYPPILLRGGYQGGKIIVEGNISSQFLSGLLMMSPMATRDSMIIVKGKLVSKPYINITLEMMKQFGIEIKHKNYCVFYVKGNMQYNSPGEYIIEGDASSASYFLGAAAIRGGTVRVNGIKRDSIQGDVFFAQVLKKMGAIIQYGKNYIECTKNKLKNINMDMNNIPDAAMTIAIVALFAKGGKTTLRNIYNWRLKETDRLKAMAIELQKIGAKVYEGKDFIKIIPPSKLITSNIETYNDHRMAMCFSLVALSEIPITILNPNCINKTFPDFFKKLDSLSIFSD